MQKGNTQKTLRKKKPAKDAIIDLANQIATPIRSTDGRNYVVMKDKKHLALPLSGGNSQAIHEICYQYYVRNNKWVGRDGINNLASYLTTRCSISEPVEVNLRSGFSDGAIHLDYGDKECHVLKVDSEKIELTRESSVIFTRSMVTGRFPELVDEASDLRELLKYVRVEEQALPALVGTIIGMWFSNIPQPIVLLHGSAGAGKTTSLRFILDLVDPSTKMPGGSLTEKVRDLKSLAVLRRVLVFDNASYVNAETSDNLARIATGGELSMCSLYENDLPHLTVIMRPILINGIMNGFTRSDLASRAISFELNAIPEEERSAFSELEREWDEAKPKIFRALLEITSRLLRNESPFWQMVTTRHRNIDLMRIIAFVSSELQIDGLTYVDNSIDSLSHVVLDSSLVSEALRATIECARGDIGECRHSDSYIVNGVKRDSQFFDSYLDLSEIRQHLEDHTPFDQRKNLPDTAKQLGEALKRVESDLINIYGVTMEKKKTNKRMKYVFSQKESYDSVSMAN